MSSPMHRVREEAHRLVKSLHHLIRSRGHPTVDQLKDAREARESFLSAAAVMKGSNETNAAVADHIASRVEGSARLLQNSMLAAIKRSDRRSAWEGALRQLVSYVDLVEDLEDDGQIVCDGDSGEILQQTEACDREIIAERLRLDNLLWMHENAMGSHVLETFDGEMEEGVDPCAYGNMGVCARPGWFYDDDEHLAPPPMTSERPTNEMRLDLV